MKKEIYRSLSLEYEKKRDRALSQAEKRKKEVVESCPELQDIEVHLKETGLKFAKSFLYEDRSILQASKDLEFKIIELKEKKKRILKKLGISEGAFNPTYECGICQDTGFIEVKNGQMCSCYKQKLINLAYKQSNLQLLEIENFNTFRSELYSDKKNSDRYGTDSSPRENILAIKGACLEFIEKFNEPKTKNLLFVGETGRGKTFLSNCIAKELLERGKTVIYQTASRLLDMIMDYKMRYERRSDFNDEEYESLFEVDLLIIDDLGTEAHNSTRFSELFNIMNTRLLTQKSKSTKTILSTNLSLERIREYYDQRIMSRLLGEFDICRFFGDDIRLKKERTV